MPINKPYKKIKRCYQCGKFISEQNSQSTVKEPDKFYCKQCYKKGLEMEYEAMGMNDPNYSSF
jgi:transcription elongation factor Elf1